MSAIPYPLDPLGKHNPYFQLVVKPGILDTSLIYGFTPYFEDGGYCKVVDWGDGTSEEATANTTLTHIYAAAGTYTVRIKANCRGIRFGPQTSYAKKIYDTNANWSALGNFTWAAAMFAGCVNAQFKIDKLPESLQNLGSMFSDCYKAELHIHKLPAKIGSCYEAFYNCYKAVINLDELTANAPQGGWTNRVTMTRMFYNAGSGNSPGTVTGSRSAFLAQFHNLAQSIQIFNNTNTTP